jgi:hypothetical protein
MGRSAVRDFKESAPETFSDCGPVTSFGALPAREVRSKGLGYRGAVRLTLTYLHCAVTVSHSLMPSGFCAPGDMMPVIVRSSIRIRKC